MTKQVVLSHDWLPMPYQFSPVEPPPHIKTSDWKDPKWQFRNSLRAQKDFEAYFNLTENEKKGFEGLGRLFDVRVTPYYAMLARKEWSIEGLSPASMVDAETSMASPNAQNSNPHPIRALIMPTAQELIEGSQAMKDPLGENAHRPTARIIHRYPDRVLFLVTDFCGVYCRYCTRKHFTGQDQVMPKASELQEALGYIRSQKQIREVILSGGDPLTLSNSALEKILIEIRKIPHIDIIRIGTRAPVVLPMRVDDEFCQMMKKYGPIFIMTHFCHPLELSLEASDCLTRLVDHGFPVMNQFPLLKGVNDSAEVVEALSRRLLYLRVKPYYMFQCDPSIGSDHFRTSVEESMEIQRRLWGRLSGLALPNLSLDIPGGGGKVGLVPNFEVGREVLPSGKTRIRYRGWDGIEGEYIS